MREVLLDAAREKRRLRCRTHPSLKELARCMLLRGWLSDRLTNPRLVRGSGCRVKGAGLTGQVSVGIAR